MFLGFHPSTNAPQWSFDNKVFIVFDEIPDIVYIQLMREQISPDDSYTIQKFNGCEWINSYIDKIKIESHYAVGVLNEV